MRRYFSIPKSCLRSTFFRITLYPFRAHYGKCSEVVLRFYCNVDTWFEAVNAKDVVAVVTPLEERTRRVQGTAK